jgi:hypothetical protein
MKKSMHINESIPVTITHVKVNRKSAKKGGTRVMCGRHAHVGYIYISLYNEESLRSSNKLVNFFKD